MGTVRVLVSSPGTAIGKFLREELSPEQFEVVEVETGIELVDALEKGAPHVAVLGRVAERPKTVQAEMRVLRDARSSVAIITVNTAPCTPATEAISRHAFRHLCGCSGVAIGPELLRLIRFAADVGVMPVEKAAPYVAIPANLSIQRPREAVS